ncbi:MAG: hypothetical protein P4L26_17700, partial [Terracidiphilus sp.]|nr:hypothetical protein [Terracidiphilus sp.]
MPGIPAGLRQRAAVDRAQGFSNYLLDQTAIRNNYTGARGAAWNSAADAMVQANPDKYSYVNTSDY